ncbi:MOP flippase family protein [Leptobacterium flavescens]|uniref:MOP flippase family protein n=1 Tax=Leptobacterium flavescens TaxID=472055 RepID=A0A6P0ULF5_9FLAO|nr:MOP flippase family protein [Leptobacterium flavescens]NER13250.1 MOP flippase family protein [Leptobacterium flavescens]
MNSIKKQVVSSVKWTTVGTVVNAIAALLKISILARFLDKSDFGLMALVTFVMGFMNLFNDMGLTSAILHKQKITKNEYASLYWFNLGFSIILYALLFLIAPLVANFYDEPELNVLIQLLGLNLIISALGRIFKTIESKHLLFKEITIFEIIAAVSSLLFAVYLAANDYGVLSLVYSALLQYLIQNVLYFSFGIKKYGLLRHFKLAETKPFIKIGVYQVGGQVINYFNRDLDILIIGKFFNQDILGGYSLAKQLVFRPAQILNPILVKVASPALAKFQSHKELLKENYLKLIGIVSKINIFVYAVTIIFAPILVQIFYGKGFDEVIPLLRILSIYMVFRAIGNPIGSLVIATGKTHLEFIWNCITFLIIPVFIFVGAGFGITYVAWALNIAMAILFYPSWKLLVNRMTGASFKEYLWAIIKPSIK